LPEFTLVFECPITVIVGENGAGKSTLLEGIAAMAGYDDAGGGKGYMPVDHSTAVEATGGRLALALRASWLPKITSGWFFKAESFFSVARYLDRAAIEAGTAPPDFLSHSHGEGFLRFSTSVATVKGSLSLMNQSWRCRHPGKSCSCDSCVALNGAGIVR
jgi:predicted ATPase